MHDDADNDTALELDLDRVYANYLRTCAMLQQLFRLQSKVMSQVLPHYGERGANDELRVREFLGRTLPKKFSIGTGFVVCSNKSIGPSSQTDIVIFDELCKIHRCIAN